MNNSTYRFTLDLQKHNSQASIAVFKNDNAVTLNISLTDGGKPYYFDKGSQAYFYGKRADDEALLHTCQFKDESEIIYVFKHSTSEVSGVVDCQIRVYDSENRLITAPRFTIVVEEPVVDIEEIEADNDTLQGLHEILGNEEKRKKAENERNEAELARWTGEEARATAEAIREENEKKRKGVWIRYSANADGTDYTESWKYGQEYIGIATSYTCPTDKDGFEWMLYKQYYEEYVPDNEVNIEFTDSGWSGEATTDAIVHLVSDKTFTVAEILDPACPFKLTFTRGTTTYYDSVLSSYVTGDEENITIYKDVPFGDETFYMYIYVVNHHENFCLENGATVPSNGIYFISYPEYGARVQRLYRGGDVLKQIDNKYIDLESHPDFKKVESLAKGASQAVSYKNYSTMVRTFNLSVRADYGVGQNVMIGTRDVPDLWVSKVYSSKSQYTYVDDATIVGELNTNGSIRVGFYEFSPLESKVTEYAKNDIVVPDKNTSERGTPGLVAMYNESSGLRLDGDKRLCIAPATQTDIDVGTSHNKPIVPAFMPYALQVFGDNFKVAVVPKNGTFQIKPGMIALLFPWKSYGTIYNSGGTSIIDTKGTSIIFATDPINTDNVMDTKGTNYQMAAICISGITSTSSHDTYSTSSGYCYFKNTHSDTSGSGYAYIYYLG